ncbi:hypothetical protein PG991_001491 [Apiospora marii]|uniref:Uncharacterized protein n=1 Tax=Apiospora marii TaxID=335849 RepID=A0ABR1SSK0_9PEZI
MAPKKNTSGASSGEEAPMTPAEMQYMIAYFQLCTPSSKPQVTDVAALGAAFDLKDKKTVMQRFNRLCDKFGLFKAQPAAANAEGPSTPAGGGAAAPKKKATGGGRKKKNVATVTPAKNDDEDDDAEAEGADEPTPSKKRKIAGDDEA